MINIDFIDNIDFINNVDFIDNIDLDVDNYTQKKLKNYLKLKDTYSNDELNSQISKFTLKIINNNYPNDYKEKLIFFINNIKDRLQIKINKDEKNEKETNYSRILSEIIDTKNSNIIKTHNNFNHNPLQYQKLNTSTINSYNEKTITVNYVFNTTFRNDFLNSIPQQCIFQLPEPINNVVRMSLLSIQIPNVMLAFSNAKFTTQIYIKEDITNFAAIVVIPEGNYDEKTFPVVLEKCINEQVINPLILPANYRFFVTIDTHTFFVTIKNIFYTFTMETIVKYPKQLGNCGLGYQLSSTNLSVNQIYNSSTQFNYSDESTLSTLTIDNTYNTSTTVSNVFLKDCIFNVKQIYYDMSYTNLNQIYFTLKSHITGALVLDAGLNKILDVKFSTLGAKVLYVPLVLITKFVNGLTNTVYSTDNVTLNNKGNYFRHNATLSANLLNAQATEFPTFYSNAVGNQNLNRNHIYTLKIYPNKSFELIQTNWGRILQNSSIALPIYTNMEEWVNHNTYDDSISYNPFFVTRSYYSSSFSPTPPPVPSLTIPAGYIKETELFQMMSGNIFVSQDPNALYMLNITLFMTHYPYKHLYTFPSQESIISTSTLPTPIDTKLAFKSKNGNLSEAYNYRFNDLDVKGKVSEISISNTLGYQIGYRLIKYEGLKSYKSESAFDKTSLDYVYFSVDEYNNSYLNHNYGVLPNENILNKNILAIITVKSPQFTTTFDNGSDYIPKLRNYFTPVNIKKIGIKLLDPLGNLVNINTNNYSFVLEFTKLMDVN